MHKIDGPGHLNNTFVSEDAAIGRAPTLVTPEWLNGVQGELTAVVEAAGLPLNKGNNQQVSEALAVLARQQKHTAFSTAGVAPNFTLTAAPAIEAYAAGLRLHVKFSTAGNGANTLNVNALGAKSLKQYDATGAKVAAVIAANQLVDVEYDGVDFVLLDPLPTLLYDLSNSFDFSTSISSGTANTLYSPNITKPKGLYLIVPYSTGWTFANAGGSYFMTAFAEIISGSGSATSINLEQSGVPYYDRTPFLLRITSATATFRFGFRNNGSTPAGQGTVTMTAGANGVGLTAYRIG